MRPLYIWNYLAVALVTAKIVIYFLCLITELKVWIRPIVFSPWNDFLMEINGFVELKTFLRIRNWSLNITSILTLSLSIIYGAFVFLSLVKPLSYKFITANKWVNIIQGSLTKTKRIMLKLSSLYSIFKVSKARHSSNMQWKAPIS